MLHLCTSVYSVIYPEAFPGSVFILHIFCIFVQIHAMKIARPTLTTVILRFTITKKKYLVFS